MSDRGALAAEGDGFRVTSAAGALATNVRQRRSDSSELASSDEDHRSRLRRPRRVRGAGRASIAAALVVELGAAARGFRVRWRRGDGESASSSEDARRPWSAELRKRSGGKVQVTVTDGPTVFSTVHDDSAEAFVACARSYLAFLQMKVPEALVALTRARAHAPDVEAPPPRTLASGAFAVALSAGAALPAPAGARGSPVFLDHTNSMQNGAKVFHACVLGDQECVVEARRFTSGWGAFVAHCSRMPLRDAAPLPSIEAATLVQRSLGLRDEADEYLNYRPRPGFDGAVVAQLVAEARGAARGVGWPWAGLVQAWSEPEDVLVALIHAKRVDADAARAILRAITTARLRRSSALSWDVALISRAEDEGMTAAALKAGVCADVVLVVYRNEATGAAWRFASLRRQRTGSTARWSCSKDAMGVPESIRAALGGLTLRKDKAATAVAESLDDDSGFLALWCCATGGEVRPPRATEARRDLKRWAKIHTDWARPYFRRLQAARRMASARGPE